MAKRDIGKREKIWAAGIHRRNAVRALTALFAGSPLLRSQQDPFRDHSRVPGLDEMVTAFDFEPVAYAKLPRQIYDYTAHGEGSEFTLRRNREAYDWVELTPRGIADGGAISTETELFGVKMALPIMVAPSSTQGDLHPEGEMAMHVAATAMNTRMILSQVSTFPPAKVTAAAAGPIWFQLYPRASADSNRELVENALTAGCTGLVVTIDQQAPVYERDLHDRNLGRAGLAGRGGNGGRAAPKNPYRVAENRIFYSWKMFDELRPVVKGPMLAKGILTPEDARLAIEHGCDGVYVSNHGGRSMDYGPSTLEVLPAIVDAVAGRVPVIFDSGIRRGSDVLKALALGAKAVGLGRTARWGLAAYGVPGAQRVIEILRAELVQAMAYTGQTSLASINRSIVRTDFP